MSIRNKFLIAFLAALISIALMYEITTMYHGLKKTKEEWAEQNSINLKTVLDMQKQSVQALAMELATDPWIIKAYKENNPQLIIEDKMAFWQQVKSENLVYEIHFFKPPAVSFVNFSNFASIGSDVQKARQDIVWITSSFRHSNHLMMCRTYAGIRATYPIIDENGTMLGGISLGKKVDWIPRTLKDLTGKDAFLVYTEASAKNLAANYYDAFVADKEVVGDYIFAERTLPMEHDGMAAIDFSVPMQEIRIGARTFVLNLYPLTDFNQKTMGYVGVLNDLQSFEERVAERTLKNLLIIGGVGLLFYLLFRGYISRTLERVASMRRMTQSFKEKRFDALDAFDLQTLERVSSRDELEGLETNIVQMGYALKDYQHSLERRVSEKTRELFDANRRLEHQLYTDGLTALPNRHAFFRDVAEWHSPAMALIDINGFQRINDLYGTAVGNMVLEQFGRFCQHEGEIRELRAYRIGSDEFALLPQGNTDAFEAQIAELIAGAEERMFFIGDGQTGIYIDLAAGISFEPEYLVETADLALHEAQHHHKNVIVYSRSMGLFERNEESLSLTKRIKNAIAEDRFVLQYQPIFDVGGRVTKHECLVRLLEDGTLISPYYFLEFAKKTRYYKAISHIVIEKSFETFRQLCHHCPFSINITVDDILDADTVLLIKEKLAGFDQPGGVVLEIVETEGILNFVEVGRFIAEARALGAKIAIDDFGSGYSNFSYILKLAPDYLKIDGSLVRNIHEDANALTLVKTIVGFAKELNIGTIAEFVHCKEVFDRCRELGIDEFQGFHLSEPLNHPLL